MSSDYVSSLGYYEFIILLKSNNINSLSHDVRPPARSFIASNCSIKFGYIFFIVNEQEQIPDNLSSLYRRLIAKQSPVQVEITIVLISWCVYVGRKSLSS